MDESVILCLMPPLRFLLLDDHQIVREGLRAMIERVPEWSVVGEADDGLEGIRLARSLDPDVMVVDMMMPGANGLEVTRRLRAAKYPGVIVMLSAHAGSDLDQAAREAGVTLLLPKSTGFAEFTSTITRVHQTVWTPPVGRENSAVSAFALSNLTPREREVLQHIASGASSKDIADVLGISSKTLDVHRHRLLQKLQASGTAELTLIAVRAGLVSL
jgi:DNA-binding NarL/FixJ family response regulator